MNYADLSVEERMKHATAYAVILNNDPLKIPEQIISELALTFLLNEQDATKAYLSCKKEFAQAYKASQKAKSSHYVIMLITFLIIGLFYLLISTESGFSGFSFFALVFLLAIIGLLSVIFKNLSEQYKLNHPSVIKLEKNIFFKALPFFALMWIVFLLQFVFTHIIKENELSVKSFVLSEKVIQKVSGGRTSVRFYNFQFKGFEKEFHFKQNDYRFAKELTDFENMSINDTVVIEILKEDNEKLNSINMFSKYNRVIGVRINNKTIIDYNYRYNKIKESHTNWFYGASFMLFANLFFLGLGYNTLKNRD